MSSPFLCKDPMRCVGTTSVGPTGVRSQCDRCGIDMTIGSTAAILLRSQLDRTVECLSHGGRHWVSADAFDDLRAAAQNFLDANFLDAKGPHGKALARLRKALGDFRGRNCSSQEDVDRLVRGIIDAADEVLNEGGGR